MFLTPEAMDLMLDRMWATAPGALVEVGLLTGDPLADGVELDPVQCPGYARYVVTDYASFWTPASGGIKQTAQFRLPAPSAGWDQAGAWDCIFVDGEPFDAAPLAESVQVDEAGPGPLVQVVRLFNEGLI